MGFLVCGFYCTRRTVEHKNDLSVLLCIQGESVAKRSTKLNQQNDSFCVSREKAIDIRKHWIEPKRHQINTGFLLAVYYCIFFSYSSVEWWKKVLVHARVHSINFSHTKKTILGAVLLSNLWCSTLDKNSRKRFNQFQ